jgi:5-methylcytosine-specific restriction endonuclease McrA
VRYRNATTITMLKTSIRMMDIRTAQPTPKKGDRFYDTPEWRARMARIVKERGRRCQCPTCETPRGPWRKIVGDHIVELQDGGAPLDPGNIMLMCMPCHGRKTADARARRQAQKHR